MPTKSESKRPWLQDQAPRFRGRAFRCPHCKAFAQQNWFALAASSVQTPPMQNFINNVDLLSDKDIVFKYIVSQSVAKEVIINRNDVEIINSNGALLKSNSFAGPVSHNVINCYISECASCKQVAIWISEEICFPFENSDIPEPNPDLPADIQKDYIEAAGIFHVSPRASAALLRLCIEKLCADILNKKSDISSMIGELVSRGLDEKVQKALESVRVIGNQAIHPGEIDIRDDDEIVYILFELVNIIADRLISQENKIMKVYSKIPSSKIAGITTRDRRSHRIDSTDD